MLSRNWHRKTNSSLCCWFEWRMHHCRNTEGTGQNVCLSRLTSMLLHTFFSSFSKEAGASRTLLAVSGSLVPSVLEPVAAFSLSQPFKAPSLLTCSFTHLVRLQIACCFCWIPVFFTFAVCACILCQKKNRKFLFSNVKLGLIFEFEL